MAIRKSKAYHEGYSACVAFQSYATGATSSNPYEDGSFEAIEWDERWAEAVENFGKE